MTDRVLDALDLDAPTLKLGEHGAWKLGDIDEAREKALAKISDRITKLQADGDKATRAKLVRAVGDFAEAACDDAAGLSDLIVRLATDKDNSGHSVLGVKALTRVVTIVNEWLTDGLTLGEG